MTDALDKLGDYMKGFECEESCRKAEKGKPLLVRLDGRAFHTFTRKMKRPFDPALTKLMQDTTQHLVEETNALIGYTQSDEISLVWYLPTNSESQYMFDGRYQKLSSTLAAIATGFFVNALRCLDLPTTGKSPTFDARAWQVPTLNDAFLALLWRERDAIKNSISMVAQAHFSHNSLNGVSGTVKKKMLAEIGDPWESYDSCYRKGTYFTRVPEEYLLNPEDLAKIPAKHRPTDGIVLRNRVKQVILPDLSSLLYLSEQERISTVFSTI